MTGVTAPAKAVYPMITDTDAGRGQDVVACEGLIRSRVVVAPLEDHGALGTENFASPLCVAAQRGGPSVCIADNDLLTVLTKKSCPNRQLLAVGKAEDGAKRDLIVTCTT